MEGKGMERKGMEEEGVDGESFVRIHLYVSLTIIPTLFNPLAWYAITQSDIHLLQHTLQTQENNNNHKSDLEVIRRVFPSPEYKQSAAPPAKENTLLS